MVSLNTEKNALLWRNISEVEKRFCYEDGLRDSLKHPIVNVLAIIGKLIPEQKVERWGEQSSPQRSKIKSDRYRIG